MTDTVSKAERSRIMSAIRSKNTRPEIVVQSIVRSMGVRFQTHQPGLPGTPDIVLTRRKKIIQVRGCFWHGHACGRCRIPSTRRKQWRLKISRNRARDLRQDRRLRRTGWSVMVVWECRITNKNAVRNRVARFLASSRRP
jgi:DNA mismatch endonuclease (patch repair protein)